MGHDYSLRELAEAVATPLNLLHHHVKKLMELGLVQVTGTRLRAGAPIKLYRATATAFLVPAELAGPTPDPLNHKLRNALARNLAGTYKGTLYNHDGTEGRMHLVRNNAVRARASEIWAELELCDTDAAALAQELSAVLKRYAGRPGKRRRHYIVHAAIAATGQDESRQAGTPA